MNTLAVVRVTFIAPDGAEIVCRAPAGETVMGCAVDAGIPGIVARCGGGCTCATCHCYVDPRWLNLLAPAGEDEATLLEFVWQPSAASRLACQIVLEPMLDGMVVRLPEHQV